MTPKHHVLDKDGVRLCYAPGDGGPTAYNGCLTVHVGTNCEACIALVPCPVVDPVDTLRTELAALRSEVAALRSAAVQSPSSDARDAVPSPSMDRGGPSTVVDHGRTWYRTPGTYALFAFIEDVPGIDDKPDSKPLTVLRLRDATDAERVAVGMLVNPNFPGTLERYATVPYDTQIEYNIGVALVSDVAAVRRALLGVQKPAPYEPYIPPDAPFIPEPR